MAATTPGRRVGRYHLVEPLGGGPNGEVFRAKVVGVAGMERQLAVKRFFPAVTQAAGVSAKLSQAARTYGGLDHPRIARLAELGVAGGETFTATELVTGLDLARLLAMSSETGSPLSAGAALGMISAAARAIGYAHGRGVAHLGLAPTNVIATPDGDVKITDVGILACRLPPRPSTDPSLVARLSYLAPEQLVGDPVAAATDVFALGVIAYELVTGARPFAGTTALELEHAILSARPPTLDLPRPVARVLDRCLARSPFERFPDARALADALDAALRLAPLDGGKRDVGEQVTAALEHIARINEQQLSGALSFAVPSPPVRSGQPTQLPLRPPSTVPRGAAGMQRTPPPVSVSPPAPPRGTTLRHNAPPMPRLQTESPTNQPTIARETLTTDEVMIDESNLSVGDDTVPRIEPMWPPTEQVPTVRPPPSVVEGSPPPATPLQRPGESQPPPYRPPPAPVAAGAAPPYPPSAAGYDPSAETGAVPRRWRAPLAMAVAAALALVGLAGLLAYRLTDPAAPAAPAVTGTAAGTVADAAPRAPAIDAGVPADAARVTARTVDAGAPVAAPIDAAPVEAAPDAAARDAAPEVAPSAPDKLLITSTPAGARVFVDGAELGKTPVTVAGSNDRLGLAVVLPGYVLHTAEVDGHGAHDARLAPVAELKGAGGIKVKCKTGGRYYVFIDGAATGQLCPTERIPAAKGDHQVEVYDLVSEARRQFKVTVKQINRSTRVKID